MRILEGPDKTSMEVPNRCAKRTTSFPGSAIHGMPASDMRPTENPALNQFSISSKDEVLICLSYSKKLTSLSKLTL